MSIVRATLTDKIKMITVTAMLSSFFIFDTTKYSSLSVFICLGFLFFVNLLSKRGNGLLIQIHPYIYWLLAFGIFCFITSVWALDRGKAISNGITIIQTMAVFTLVSCCYQDSTDVKYLIKAIYWSGIVVSLYTIRFYGSDLIRTMISASTRIGNDFANSNTVGMWLAICITICAHLFFTEGWKWSRTFVVFPIVILAMTQSRTALVETLLGVFLAYLLNKNSKNWVHTIRTVAFAAVIVVIIIFIMSKIPIFDAVFSRMNSLQAAYNGGGDSSAQVRLYYIKLGFDTFLKNPFWGVGMGSSYIVTGQYSTHSTYFHNNYVELLASGGIFCFLLYYSIHFKCIKYYLKTRKYKNSEHNNICLIILILLIISDYGTVSYYKKYMLFLILVCSLQMFLSTKEDYIKT